MKIKVVAKNFSINTNEFEVPSSNPFYSVVRDVSMSQANTHMFLTYLIFALATLLQPYNNDDDDDDEEDDKDKEAEEGDGNTKRKKNEQFRKRFNNTIFRLSQSIVFQNNFFLLRSLLYINMFSIF